MVTAAGCARFLLFTSDLARRLVVTDAKQARVPELAVHGPFDERDLDDDLRPDPVGAQARQAAGFRERRTGNLEPVEPRAQIEQELRVEARADFPGEDEVAAVVVADEERAEPDARALRIREPADDELLRR